MKNVKVELLTDTKELVGENGVIFPSVSFAFCSSPAKGTGQACQFRECREGIMSFLIDFHKGSPYTKKYLIDIKKTRILLLSRLTGDFHNYANEGNTRKKRRDGFNSWVRQSLHMINYFERLAHWPLSKLAKVDHNLGDMTDIYLFVGSNRWIRSPHMLSLYLLLIRLGRNKEYKGFRSHKKFISVSEKLIKKVNPSRYYDIASKMYDCKHLAKVYKKIRIIMKNFDSLFSRSAKYSFTAAIKGPGLPHMEGITKLAIGETNDHELYHKLNELCE